ncbi:hypothetical protein SALBM311S_06229 [Streptomyces alboniger]
MDRYPPIADHGLVGDLQTAALVTSQGVIDWFAAPRFDSPSVFAALLDHENGGYFLLAPEHPEGTWRQLYYPDSAAVVTRFMSPDGVGEIIDHMPVQQGPTATDRHRLVRVVRAVRGTVRFRLECRPRFDYARATHELDLTARTATFRAPGMTAYLQGGIPLERDGQDVRGTITLNAGESTAAVFTVCAPGGKAPPPPTTEEVTEGLWQDIDFWHKWVRPSRYNGRWTEIVHRSAITLKLLTYHPTGAPVAAATMGLPEQVGGERNWDYRYTWVRDGSLSVRALLDLGFVEEATRFTHWLGDRLAAHEGPNGEPLQIMYRVDGDPHLTEEILDHFEGYRRSSPVRAGNAASDQLQLDIYGEALYALAEGRDVGEQAGYHGWRRHGGDVLDASLLLAPRVGFLSPRSPGWLNTLDAMDRVLVSDSLVYRYDPEASPDGLRGSEGTFSLCTFLYVDALARAGRLPQARYTFEKMQTYANHVGLFAEEIGPSGEQLGNFPQAFTHLSLIMAATTLDDALDRHAA